MKKLKRKLKNRRGFTMAEMLLAVLILLLVSGLMATGIPAAKNAYEKVVLASDAELLLSTAINELRNELGTARDVNVAGTTITYVNSQNGATSEISLSESADPVIQLKRSANTDEDPVSLVYRAASTGIYVTYGSVVPPADGDPFIVFNNIQVKRGNSVLAEYDSFPIRILSVT